VRALSPFLPQNSAGVPGSAERWDRFGTTVRLADHTKDGRPELVVGAPGEDVAGDNRELGGIWVFKGTRTGPGLSSSYDVMAKSTGLTRDRDTNWSSILAP
jgi:hypothetical protein